MNVAAEIVVKGQVQGVGFRFYCRARAVRLGLTGTVRNARDGSVEVRAEGAQEQVEALVEELQRGPSGAIVTDVAVRWTAFTGTFKQFEIVR